MSVHFHAAQCRDLEFSSRREWLLPNGIGGYAMGTVAGIATRRYHGLLIAAGADPAERRLLVAAVEAHASLNGHLLPLGSNQYPGAIHPEGHLYLESFEADTNHVAWTYADGPIRIQKQVSMTQGANRVSVAYSNLGDRPVAIAARPLVAARDHHANFFETPDFPLEQHWEEHATAILAGEDRLRIEHAGAKRAPVQGWYYRFEHEREAERGLNPRDDLYCPCELRYLVNPGEEARIVFTDGSTGPELSVGDPAEASDLWAQAASVYRLESTSRKTIVAGYPWFTDWGRDAMIAVPGLCVATGKTDFGREVIRSFARQLDQGLIPNRFVESGRTPEYHTVDATLWMANSIYETLVAEWNEEFADEAAGWLDEVFAWHERGTRFGIGVDAKDGLLAQGVPGVQLTWMDAKIGDWVVTPRHGKPVEVNGLWINALRIMEWLAEKRNRSSKRFRLAAEKAEASFAKRFWCSARGCYFDTVDPDDASLRPNQIIPMSLPFGPATGDRAERALGVCREALLTPRGLRTLGPNEPKFEGRFEGPLRELDAAYHQGTVWPWLIGPYCAAVLRLTGDADHVRDVLGQTDEMLTECGILGIAEVYDGMAPHRPNGCPWQAWSVASILWAKWLLERFESAAKID